MSENQRYRVRTMTTGLNFGWTADVVRGRRVVHETATYGTRGAAERAAEAWVARKMEAERRAEVVR
jgi:hypothetical protein